MQRSKRLRLAHVTFAGFHFCVLSFGLNSCSVLQSIIAINNEQTCPFGRTNMAVEARVGTRNAAMVYRRTHQVEKRLAARRSTILSAARHAASEGGIAAVEIAPVGVRAHVAPGTGHRDLPA